MCCHFQNEHCNTSNCLRKKKIKKIDKLLANGTPLSAQQRAQKKAEKAALLVYKLYSHNCKGSLLHAYVVL